MRLTPRRMYRNSRKVIRDIKHRVIGLPWLEVEPRDRFLASFPRSGNTWLRHILYFYVTGSETVDMSALDNFAPILDGINLRPKLAKMAGAEHRYIKTHELPADYLMTGKTVYLTRDGRDATWSWHRYNKSFDASTPDFDTFLKNCLEDRYRYRAWHTNVGAWLKYRDNPSVFFLRFEDMRADPAGAFDAVLRHIGLPIDAARAAWAVERADPNTVAQTFKSEIAARRAPGDGAGQGGVVERWRTEYTPEQLDLFERKAGPVLEAFGYTLSKAA